MIADCALGIGFRGGEAAPGAQTGGWTRKIRCMFAAEGGSG